MAMRELKTLRQERRRRGAPEETRARLVAGAAEVFNREGYFGTDSTGIAREAGYAAGTFYKHFPDKRAILLAAYENWVTAEWRAIEEEMAAGGAPGQVAGRIVDLVVRLHTRWRGLRASLLALVPVDANVRRFYRDQRRRQLALIAEMRRRRGARPRPAAEDAVLLFALERSCDAIAVGEVRDLSLDRDEVLLALRALVERAL